MAGIGFAVFCLVAAAPVDPARIGKPFTMFACDDLVVPAVTAAGVFVTGAYSKPGCLLFFAWLPMLSLVFNCCAFNDKQVVKRQTAELINILIGDIKFDLKVI